MMTNDAALLDLRSRFYTETRNLPDEWQDWRNDFLREFVLAADRALSADRGEAVAWMDDDGRVIDAKAKAAGERSGGATKSAADAFSIPLYSFSAGHAASHADVSDAALIAISKESVHGLRLAAMLRGDVNAMDFRAALFALIRELYAATPPSPADTSTGDDARHARENPPLPLPPATLLYENEGDGTKVYGYTAEQMQARVSPAESAECRCHEGNGARHCATHTQADFDAQAAAPSQVSRITEEMVLAACNAYDADTTGEPAAYPWMHAALVAALEAAQPQPGRVEGMDTWFVSGSRGWPGGIEFRSRDEAIAHIRGHDGLLHFWIHQANRKDYTREEVAAMIAAAPTAGGDA